MVERSTVAAQADPMDCLIDHGQSTDNLII